MSFSFSLPFFWKIIYNINQIIVKSKSKIQNFEWNLKKSKWNFIKSRTKSTNKRVILIIPKVNFTKKLKDHFKNLNKKYNKNQIEIDKTRLKFYKIQNEI